MTGTDNNGEREFEKQENAILFDQLLTAKQVAVILGVRLKRVYELGIPAIRLSERSIRWRPETVAQWIREREAT